MVFSSEGLEQWIKSGQAKIKEKDSANERVAGALNRNINTDLLLYGISYGL